MTVHPLFGPIILLAVWTIVMLFVAIFKIIGGTKGLKFEGLPKNPTGRDLEGHAPHDALCARRNYEHLLEQPTIFYVLCFALILMGYKGMLATALAYIYVVLRIVHSIMQTMNKSRAFWFTASTLCLIVIAGINVGYFVGRM